MSYATLQLELGDPVSTLTLNRPDKLNALAQDLLDDMLSALNAVRNHEATRALIVTGAGRGFCAGADLSDGLDSTDPQEVADETRRRMAERFNPVVAQLQDLNVPTIAAVNGVRGRRGRGPGVEL